MNVQNIRRLDDEAGLLGTIELFGAAHHVHLIEVEDADGVQRPVHDPYGRYEDLQRLYEGRYETVAVPGFAGTYVACVVPYAR